jgi:hypothetical protein
LETSAVAVSVTIAVARSSDIGILVGILVVSVAPGRCFAIEGKCVGGTREDASRRRRCRGSESLSFEPLHELATKEAAVYLIEHVKQRVCIDDSIAGTGVGV